MKLRYFALAGLLIVIAIGIAAFLGSGAEEYPAPKFAQETNRSVAQGQLVGYEHHANPVHVWKTIPFAAPPTGDLRWRAPRAPENWEGVREALDDAPWCVQMRRSLDDGSSADALPLGAIMGQEDCLYLNIYAPAMDAELAVQSKLPVMMWIHGGSNFWGRAEQYDPSALVAKENVIVAVIQYRLAPFGWFAHDAIENSAQIPNDKSPNFAILDQIAALDWLAENVGVFGGDASNITIFGESAGGHNVATLLASPLAAGKFHKAIIQSGSFNSVSLEEAKSGGPDAGEAIASKMLGDKVSAKALRSASVDDIYAAFGPKLYERNWQPPRIIEDDIVVPKTGLANAFQSTETFNAVPVITGTTRDESKLFLIGADELVEQRFGFLPRIREPQIYDALAEYQSRLWRVGAVDDPARLMQEAGHTDVYAYRFDWDEAGSFLGSDFSQLLGAAHAMEIPFVLGRFRMFGDADRWIFTDDNEKGRLQLSRAMMGYWAEFARTGQPGNGGEEGLPKWQPWSSDPAKANILLLDSNADGGINFVANQETLGGVAKALFSDKRLTSDEITCRVYRAAEPWNKGFAKHNKMGCGSDISTP